MIISPCYYRSIKLVGRLPIGQLECNPPYLYRYFDVTVERLKTEYKNAVRLNALYNLNRNILIIGNYCTLNISLQQTEDLINKPFRVINYPKMEVWE